MLGHVPNVEDHSMLELRHHKVYEFQYRPNESVKLPGSINEPPILYVEKILKFEQSSTFSLNQPIRN